MERCRKRVGGVTSVQGGIGRSYIYCTVDFTEDRKGGERTGREIDRVGREVRGQEER